MYNKIVEKNFEPDFSIKDLLSDKDNQFSKWQDIYTIIAEMQAREVLEMPLENEKEKEYLSKLTENKAWDSLCSAWIYLCFRSDEFLKEVKEINQIYEEYMQDIYIEKKEEKMLNYMEKHLRYAVHKDLIRAEIERYKEEWLELAALLEKRPYLNRIEELKYQYGTLTNNISKAYVKYMGEEK